MFRQIFSIFDRFTDPNRRFNSPNNGPKRTWNIFIILGITIAVSGFIGVALGLFDFKTAIIAKTGVRFESNVIISSTSRGDATTIHHFETITTPNRPGAGFRGLRIAVPDSFEGGQGSAELFFDSAQVNGSEASVEQGESKNGRTTYTIMANENSPPASPGELNKVVMQYRHVNAVLTNDTGRAHFAWAVTRQLNPAPEATVVSVTLPLWVDDCSDPACKPQCSCAIESVKSKERTQSEISGSFIQTPQGDTGRNLITYQASSPRPLSATEYVSCQCDY